MNPKEIGIFLKGLRNEKGITQEQLAEILGVSGRTVSRWETGNNLPDLSVLVEISEYYDVEIKEILNGERKSESMDGELKETLLKVADYNELKKQRTAKIGSISFMFMFLLCAATIVVQILITGNLSLVIGENIILFIGGLVYLISIAMSGLWQKSTPKKDFMISIAMAGTFSVIFCLLIKAKAGFPGVMGVVICFFLLISAVSYALLRGFASLSRKKSDK